jgi:two-component system sensor histidine kinase BaeS
MVLNLLLNALRYTPPGGSVQLAVRRADADAVVVVRDTGIGITAEHLPHIFTRFYRVDRARSRQHDSHGLGLAIVKRIAESHGGTVSVTSVPGAGSAFTVTLPCITGSQTVPSVTAALPA